MKTLDCMVAMSCLLAVQAVPSGSGHNEHISLEGIPDVSSYQKLVYPHFDIQELGTVSHGDLPSKEIKVTRTIKITVPHPYPVKVPHKVPYPIHVPKPYPVEVTKLVEVPKHIPVEVIKSIAVPVEVPKPYPVPAHEYHSQQQGGGHQEYGPPQHNQGWGPSGQDSYQYNSYQQGHFESREGYNSQEGHEDQSVGYPAVVPSQQQNVENNQEQVTAHQQEQQEENNFNH